MTIICILDKSYELGLELGDRNESMTLEEYLNTVLGNYLSLYLSIYLNTFISIDPNSTKNVFYNMFSI